MSLERKDCRARVIYTAPLFYLQSVFHNCFCFIFMQEMKVSVRPIYLAEDKLSVRACAALLELS